MFFGPDGVALNSSPVKVPFYFGTRWPNFELFKLTIKESPTNTFSAPTVSAGDDFVVYLPRGTYVDVQLSCYLDVTSVPSAGPQTMGILGWIKTASELAYLAGLTANGLFWMITPYRKLRLIHAVQQPAGPAGFPKFSSLSQTRIAGETFASLMGGMEFHGPSTVKLDLLAAWEEPVDSPGPDPYNPQPVQDGHPWGAPGLTPPGPTSGRSPPRSTRS